MELESLVYFFEYKQDVLHFSGCSLLEYSIMFHQRFFNEPVNNWRFDFVYHDN